MMKLLIAVLALCVQLKAFGGDPEDIAKSFQDYKSALLEQKGETAAGLVTKRTIAEYQLYVDLALSADREKLESLSFINRFQVLLLKQRIPEETLRQLDGRSVFAYAVDRDWIGKNGVIRTTIGAVDVANKRATAEVLIGGEKVPNRFQFTQEDGIWKFDLIQVIRDTDAPLREMVKQRQMTENEFIFSIVETISGEKVDDSIWLPMKKAEPAGE